MTPTAEAKVLDINPSVADLIHGLRQPLSIIETCCYCMRLKLNSGEADLTEQLDQIDAQILEASLMLLQAAGERFKSCPRTNAESSALT